MNNELNHPFFIYPRGFMSEYNEYSLYRQEVIRLYNFIGNLSNKLDEKYSYYDVLIPFIIGSPMEDALAKLHTTFDNIFQYSQLFPNYINKFISYNKNKKFIQIIIISPDNIFSPNSTHTPYFSLYSPYDFVNTNFNEYIYLDEFIEINVNIFNCPFPCVETRNSLVIRYQQMIDTLNPNTFNITTYKQNQTDINFINSFYSSLDKLFSKSISESRIKIIINSWVSFKNLDGYSENYEMFPNLLKLANKYNIIATEWDFIDNLTFTKIVSNYGDMNGIGNKNFHSCYINYVSDKLSKPEQDIGTNLFVIDFNLKYCLKN
jgi:hypothetical protein